MEKVMQLNDETLAVLKNFASIQPNVVLNEGNVVKTIAEAKNVMAVATLGQTFDKTVGIYNLDEFLAVLGLVDTPDLNFQDDFVTVKSGAGRSQVKYFYSDPSILTSPAKDIPMPDAEVKFTLDESTFKKVLRAAGALGHEKMTITATDGGIKLTVVDNTDSTSNAFEIVVPGTSDSTDFTFVMNIANLKLIGGDYDVEVSSRLISKFTNQSADICYYIALEKSSNYGA
jgi:hypothetical protein